MTTTTLIALQMPYTDAQGDTHPTSLWIPDAMTQDIIDRQGGIPFGGWSSATTLQAKDAPCGQHNVQVGTAAFVAGSGETDAQVAVALGMPATGITEAQNTAYLCISLALATLDTPAPANTDGTPATNGDGTPKMQSFFQGASITTVQVTD